MEQVYIVKTEDGHILSPAYSKYEDAEKYLNNLIKSRGINTFYISFLKVV